MYIHVTDDRGVWVGSYIAPPTDRNLHEWLMFVFAHVAHSDIVRIMEA